MKLTIISVLAASLVVVGCKKSEDDSKKEPAAKVTTEPTTPTTKVPSKPTATPIPITTKSEEAKEALLKARALMDQTDYLLAEPHLKKAIELDPDFAQAHALLSEIAGEDREVNRAKANELLDSLPAIEKHYLKTIVSPNRRDPAVMKKLLDELTEAAPNSPRALIRAANYYGFQANEQETSIELLKRVIELDPDNVEAYNSLAYAYQKTGKPELAIKAAKKQVELSPGKPNPIDTLADLELAAGKFAEAEANYRKAFAADKTYTLSLAGAAATQLYRRDFDGAAATFAEADKAETVAQQRFGRAMERIMMKAIAGDTKGALASAGDLAEPAKTLRFDPPSTIAMARSRVHIHNGDWKKAHEEMGKAVKALAKGESREGRAGFTYMGRVMTAARVGDKAAAEKAFKTMETTFKGGPVHTIASAHLDWARGDTDGALQKLDSLKGSGLYVWALDAAATILDQAKRPGDAKAKRDELRKLYTRNLDDAMLWLQHTKE